ncbi:MAG: hypothetical protein OXE50_00740, partial [Chloroflexi bacterium]|nr:hypothetical protein [Chloroflexota bacterium]
MTESTYRMRLLTVHPLDAPVVALAASMTAPDQARGRAGRGRLTAVGAVKCHGSRELDSFHAADASAMTALAGFADGSPIVAHGLAEALGEDAASALSAGVWDVRELAELLVPASADDSLVQLAARLGVAPPPPDDGRAEQPPVRDARPTYAVS